MNEKCVKKWTPCHFVQTVRGMGGLRGWHVTDKAALTFRDPKISQRQESMGFTAQNSNL